MIIVRSRNLGDRDATLTDFLLKENSKLSPKAFGRTSSSEFSSTGRLVNIGRLM